MLPVWQPGRAATIRAMADEHAPQSPRPTGQHDTDVLWPTAGGGGSAGYGYPCAEQPLPPQQPHAYAQEPQAYLQEPQAYAQQSQAYAPGSPEAAYWESKYRRQRTWTRVLGATMVAGLLLLVGGGLLLWTVVLPRAASTVTQQLSDVLPGLGLPDSDGSVPAPSTPNAPEGGDGQAPAPEDLSDVPLPDQLRGLGSMLGITNLEQLLDTAVSMGLMTEAQADQLREAIASGGVEGLTGSALGLDSGTSHEG